MQLAVNYTPKAAALLEDEQINVDIYKCPDWPELIRDARQQRPVYVHFPLQVGRGKVNDVDWAQVDRLMKTTRTTYVNLHLAPNANDYPEMRLDTQDPAWADKLVAQMLADIEVVKARYGAEWVILENAPWDPHPQYAIPRPAIDPAVITQVVEASGCGLLLDTAHARIAALHLGMDEVAYLDAMPVAHLRELHITGTRSAGDHWEDHFPMQAADWRLAEYAFDQIRAGHWPQPDIVALEYGGVGPLFDWRTESAVLAVEVPRLWRMVRSTERLLAAN